MFFYSWLSKWKSEIIVLKEVLTTEKLQEKCRQCIYRQASWRGLRDLQQHHDRNKWWQIQQKKKWWQYGYQQDFTAASRWSFVISDSVQRFDSDLCRGEWQWRRREKKNRRQSLGKNWLGLLNETIKREGIFVRSIKNKWADSFGV